MTLLNRTLWFILLLVLQVLVFNQIHFMGYATPVPFFYLLLMLHSKTSRWVYVSLGFTLGLLVDIASNTIGECAAVTTLLGLVTPRLLTMFSPPDLEEEGFQPSARTMKWSGFVGYAALATLLFCTLFFLIENFSFLHIVDLAISIVASSALTLLIICAMERIRISADRK